MSKTANLVIVGITVAFIVIYAIILAVTYNKKSFIFSEYTPKMPDNAFNPLGTVTKLTPEQQQARKQAYTRPPP